MPQCIVKIIIMSSVVVGAALSCCVKTFPRFYPQTMQLNRCIVGIQLPVTRGRRRGRRCSFQLIEWFYFIITGGTEKDHTGYIVTHRNTRYKWLLMSNRRSTDHEGTVHHRTNSTYFSVVLFIHLWFPTLCPACPLHVSKESWHILKHEIFVTKHNFGR